MECRHQIKNKDPKIRASWNTSEANEMCRLFQGFGEGDQDGQRIKGANVFFFIERNKDPKNKVKKVVCARIVCNIREMKKIIGQE